MSDQIKSLVPTISIPESNYVAKQLTQDDAVSKIAQAASAPVVHYEDQPVVPEYSTSLWNDVGSALVGAGQGLITTAGAIPLVAGAASAPGSAFTSAIVNATNKANDFVGSLGPEASLLANRQYQDKLAPSEQRNQVLESLGLQSPLKTVIDDATNAVTNAGATQIASALGSVAGSFGGGKVLAGIGTGATKLALRAAGKEATSAALETFAKKGTSELARLDLRNAGTAALKRDSDAISENIAKTQANLATATDDFSRASLTNDLNVLQDQQRILQARTAQFNDALDDMSKVGINAENLNKFKAATNLDDASLITKDNIARVNQYNSITNPITAAVTEGLGEASDAITNTYQQGNEIPVETLYKNNPDFANAYRKYLNEGMSMKDAEQAARNELTGKAARLAAGVQLGIGALTGGLSRGLEFGGEVIPSTVKKSLFGLGTNAALGMAEEGIQEGGSQLASNLGIQEYLNPEQSLTESVGQNAAAGILGAGSNMATRPSTYRDILGAVIGTPKAAFNTVYNRFKNVVPGATVATSPASAAEATAQAQAQTQANTANQETPEQEQAQEQTTANTNNASEGVKAFTSPLEAVDTDVNEGFERNPDYSNEIRENLKAKGVYDEDSEYVPTKSGDTTNLLRKTLNTINRINYLNFSRDKAKVNTQYSPYEDGTAHGDHLNQDIITLNQAIQNIDELDSTDPESQKILKSLGAALGMPKSKTYTSGEIRSKLVDLGFNAVRDLVSMTKFESPSQEDIDRANQVKSLWSKSSNAYTGSVYASTRKAITDFIDNKGDAANSAALDRSIKDLSNLNTTLNTEKDNSSPGSVNDILNSLNETPTDSENAESKANNYKAYQRKKNQAQAYLKLAQLVKDMAQQSQSSPAFAKSFYGDLDANNDSYDSGVSGDPDKKEFKPLSDYIKEGMDALAKGDHNKIADLVANISALEQSQKSKADALNRAIKDIYEVDNTKVTHKPTANDYRIDPDNWRYVTKTPGSPTPKNTNLKLSSPNTWKMLTQPGYYETVKSIQKLAEQDANLLNQIHSTFTGALNGFDDAVSAKLNSIPVSTAAVWDNQAKWGRDLSSQIKLLKKYREDLNQLNNEGRRINSLDDAPTFWKGIRSNILNRFKASYKEPIDVSNTATKTEIDKYAKDAVIAAFASYFSPERDLKSKKFLGGFRWDQAEKSFNTLMNEQGSKYSFPVGSTLFGLYNAAFNELVREDNIENPQFKIDKGNIKLNLVEGSALNNFITALKALPNPEKSFTGFSINKENQTKVTGNIFNTIWESSSSNSYSRRNMMGFILSGIKNNTKLMNSLVDQYNEAIKDNGYQDISLTLPNEFINLLGPANFAELNAELSKDISTDPKATYTDPYSAAKAVQLSAPYTEPKTQKIVDSIKLDPTKQLEELAADIVFADPNTLSGSDKTKLNSLQSFIADHINSSISQVPSSIDPETKGKIDILDSIIKPTNRDTLLRDPKTGIAIITSAGKKAVYAFGNTYSISEDNSISALPSSLSKYVDDINNIVGKLLDNLDISKLLTRKQHNADVDGISLGSSSFDNATDAQKDAYIKAVGTLNQNGKPYITLNKYGMFDVVTKDGKTLQVNSDLYLVDPETNETIPYTSQNKYKYQKLNEHLPALMHVKEQIRTGKNVDYFAISNKDYSKLNLTTTNTVDGSVAVMDLDGRVYKAIKQDNGKIVPTREEITKTYTALGYKEIPEQDLVLLHRFANINKFYDGLVKYKPTENLFISGLESRKNTPYAGMYPHEIDANLDTAIRQLKTIANQNYDNTFKAKRDSLYAAINQLPLSSEDFVDRVNMATTARAKFALDSLASSKNLNQFTAPLNSLASNYGIREITSANVKDITGFNSETSIITSAIAGNISKGSSEVAKHLVSEESDTKGSSKTFDTLEKAQQFIADMNYSEYYQHRIEEIDDGKEGTKYKVKSMIKPSVALVTSMGVAITASDIQNQVKSEEDIEKVKDILSSSVGYHDPEYTKLVLSKSTSENLIQIELQKAIETLGGVRASNTKQYSSTVSNGLANFVGAVTFQVINSNIFNTSTTVYDNLSPSTSTPESTKIYDAGTLNSPGQVKNAQLIVPVSFVVADSSIVGNTDSYTFSKNSPANEFNPKASLIKKMLVINPKVKTLPNDLKATYLGRDLDSVSNQRNGYIMGLGMPEANAAEIARVKGKVYKNSDESQKILKSVNDTKYYLDKEKLDLFKKIGPEMLAKAAGYYLDPAEEEFLNTQDFGAKQSRHNSFLAGYEDIIEYGNQAEIYSKANNVPIEEISFNFPNTFTSLSRLQPLGRSPMTDKVIREVMYPYEPQTDLTNPIVLNSFKVGIAQAFGAKPEKLTNETLTDLFNEHISRLKDIYTKQGIDNAEDALTYLFTNEGIDKAYEAVRAFPRTMLAVSGLRDLTNYMFSTPDQLKNAKVFTYLESDGKAAGVNQSAMMLNVGLGSEDFRTKLDVAASTATMIGNNISYSDAFNNHPGILQKATSDGTAIRDAYENVADEANRSIKQTVEFLENTLSLFNSTSNDLPTSKGLDKVNRADAPKVLNAAFQVLQLVSGYSDAIGTSTEKAILKSLNEAGFSAAMQSNKETNPSAEFTRIIEYSRLLASSLHFALTNGLGSVIDEFNRDGYVTRNSVKISTTAANYQQSPSSTKQKFAKGINRYIFDTIAKFNKAIASGIKGEPLNLFGSNFDERKSSLLKLLGAGNLNVFKSSFTLKAKNRTESNPNGFDYSLKMVNREPGSIKVTESSTPLYKYNEAINAISGSANEAELESSFNKHLDTIVDLIGLAFDSKNVADSIYDLISPNSSKVESSVYEKASQNAIKVLKQYDPNNSLRFAAKDTGSTLIKSVGNIYGEPIALSVKNINGESNNTSSEIFNAAANNIFGVNSAIIYRVSKIYSNLMQKRLGNTEGLPDTITGSPTVPKDFVLKALADPDSFSSLIPKKDLDFLKISLPKLVMSNTITINTYKDSTSFDNEGIVANTATQMTYKKSLDSKEYASWVAKTYPDEKQRPSSSILARQFLTETGVSTSSPDNTLAPPGVSAVAITSIATGDGNMQQQLFLQNPGAQHILPVYDGDNIHVGNLEANAISKQLNEIEANNQFPGIFSKLFTKTKGVNDFINEIASNDAPANIANSRIHDVVLNNPWNKELEKALKDFTAKYPTITERMLFDLDSAFFTQCDAKGEELAAIHVLNNFSSYRDFSLLDSKVKSEGEGSNIADAEKLSNIIVAPSEALSALQETIQDRARDETINKAVIDSLGRTNENIAAASAISTPDNPTYHYVPGRYSALVDINSPKSLIPDDKFYTANLAKFAAKLAEVIKPKTIYNPDEGKWVISKDAYPSEEEAAQLLKAVLDEGVDIKLPEARFRLDYSDEEYSKDLKEIADTLVANQPVNASIYLAEPLDNIASKLTQAGKIVTVDLSGDYEALLHSLDNEGLSGNPKFEELTKAINDPGLLDKTLDKFKDYFIYGEDLSKDNLLSVSPKAKYDVPNPTIRYFMALANQLIPSFYANANGKELPDNWTETAKLSDLEPYLKQALNVAVNGNDVNGLYLTLPNDTSAIVLDRTSDKATRRHEVTHYIMQKYIDNNISAFLKQANKVKSSKDKQTKTSEQARLLDSLGSSDAAVIKEHLSTLNDLFKAAVETKDPNAIEAVDQIFSSTSINSYSYADKGNKTLAVKKLSLEEIYETIKALDSQSFKKSRNTYVFRPGSENEFRLSEISVKDLMSTLMQESLAYATDPEISSKLSNIKSRWRNTKLLTNLVKAAFNVLKKFFEYLGIKNSDDFTANKSQLSFAASQFLKEPSISEKLTVLNAFAANGAYADPSTISGLSSGMPPSVGDTPSNGTTYKVYASKQKQSEPLEASYREQFLKKLEYPINKLNTIKLDLNNLDEHIQKVDYAYSQALRSGIRELVEPTRAEAFRKAALLNQLGVLVNSDQNNIMSAITNAFYTNLDPIQDAAFKRLFEADNLSIDKSSIMAGLFAGSDEANELAANIRLNGSSSVGDAISNNQNNLIRFFSNLNPAKSNKNILSIAKSIIRSKSSDGTDVLDMASEKFEQYLDKADETVKNTLGKTSVGKIAKYLNPDEILKFSNKYISDDLHTIKGIIKDVVGRTDKTHEIYRLLNKSKSYAQKARQIFREGLPRSLKQSLGNYHTEGNLRALGQTIGKMDLSYFEDPSKAQEFFSNPRRYQVIQNDRYNDLMIRNNYDRDAVDKQINILVNFLNGKNIPKHEVLYKNATAIAWKLHPTASNMRIDRFIKANKGIIDAIGNQINLKLYNSFSVNDRKLIADIRDNAKQGFGEVIGSQFKVDTNDVDPAIIPNTLHGYKFQDKLSDGNLVIQPLKDKTKLEEQGYTLVKPHESVKGMGYFYSDFSSKARFNQGIYQTVIPTSKGVNTTTGVAMNKYISADTLPDRVTTSIPVFGRDGKIYKYEMPISTEIRDQYLNYDDSIDNMLGASLGRLDEVSAADTINEALLEELQDMYENASDKDKAEQFINVFKSKDPIIQDALSNMTKFYKYKIGKIWGTDPVTGQPNMYIRKDLVNDVIGERSASVGDLFTGLNRFSPETQKHIRTVLSSFLGPKAYRRLVTAERYWQQIVASGKEIVVVRSVIVPAVNMIANVLQLMQRGVPLKTIAAHTANKVRELKYANEINKQLQLNEVKLLNPNITDADKVKLRNSSKILEESLHKLSIWPLLENGEFSTVQDMGFDTVGEDLRNGSILDKIDDFASRFGDVGKALVVHRDTKLYKLLQTLLQYGDFVAKSLYYDHLTNKKHWEKDDALRKVADEFVDYDRLPGRTRGYLESIGMLLFGNFLLRSAKVGADMVINQPFRTLLHTLNPANPVGSPVTDNFLVKSLTGKLGYSMGPANVIDYYTRFPALAMLL